MTLHCHKKELKYKMKVFLLEDDYNLNEAIKDSLEIYNLEVTSFYDGKQAFENLTNSYDIYILDINTPHISGLELLSIIKSMNQSSKVLIISANIDMETIRRAYNLYCDDYLKKPFDVEELLLKIKKYLPNEERIFINEDTIYDFYLKKIFVNDKQIELTKNEKTLLFLLMKNKSSKISYPLIEDYVYGGISKSSDSIRSLVKRLRKKLPKDLILNSLDEGYYIK